MHSQDTTCPVVNNFLATKFTKLKTLKNDPLNGNYFANSIMNLLIFIQCCRFTGAFSHSEG